MTPEKKLDTDVSKDDEVAVVKPKVKRKGRILKWLMVGALLLVGLPLASITWSLWYCVAMPGEPFEGELAPLSARESASEPLLGAHVKVLATDIGPREVHTTGTLQRAEDYLVGELEGAGYEVVRQVVVADGLEANNLEVTVKGSTSPDEIVVIGAHYDTVPETPGADDNASGTAVALEMAKHYASRTPARTVRFVFFVNEEPPWFKEDKEMGSFVYAKSCSERGDNVVAMLSLEMLGYYTDEPGSQHYPAPFSMLYSDRANFVAFVGDLDSRDLLHRVIARFRASTDFPSDGLAGPHAVPGVTFSDQWSFWMHGYPGLMVTDTAFNRNAHYHEPTDTADKLDFAKMARVMWGLVAVLDDLAGA